MASILSLSYRKNILWNSTVIFKNSSPYVRSHNNLQHLKRLIFIVSGSKKTITINKNDVVLLSKSKDLIFFKQQQNHRNISSLFGTRLRKLRAPGIFLIGFCCMTIYLILEFIFDNYRRSGLTLKEFLFSKSSSIKVLKLEELNEEYFETKFASVIKSSDVPKTIQLSRIVPGIISLPNNMKFTLFQYQNCPFCCKVRIFLDYYGLPYEIVEVNPVMRKEIKFSKHYHKVPILLVSKKSNDASREDFNESATTNDQILQINDSTLIISILNSYLLSLNPKSKHHGESIKNMVKWYLNSQVLVNELEENEQNNSKKFLASKINQELINRYFLMIGDVDERKYEKIDPLLALDRRWRRWVDDHFVHILSPNIYRTFDESLRSFQYFSQVSEWDKHFKKWEIFIITYLGATVMYFVSKNLKKKYGLKDDVRQSLYDSCNYWLKQIGSHRQFMGGDKPGLSDLTVFSVLSSIEGCDAFADLLSHTKISNWYFAMKSMVEQHQGAQDIKHLFD